jgi:cytochrome c-type biogenesis protein CcmH
MKTLALIFLFVLALTLGAQPAAAQDPGPTPSPDDVNAIAENLYCPVCANVPVDACGTPACIQWRQQIADMLAQGYTEQQIYDYFAQFGPNVLAAPPATGINWLIYILPPLGILAGAIIIWRFLQRSTHRSAPRVESGRGSSKAAKQLERELKARR